MTDEEIDARIAAIVAGPKKAANEMGSVEQFTIDELLALKKQNSADNAVQTPSRGIRFSKIIPPGASC